MSWFAAFCWAGGAFGVLFGTYVQGVSLAGCIVGTFVGALTIGVLDGWLRRKVSAR
jgi:hypothetical protein